MLRYIMLLMLIAALMVWISPPAVAGQIPDTWPHQQNRRVSHSG